MREVFLRVLEMSLTASWVMAAVLAARLLLRKAPRRYTYWLWLVVLFRLVCPFTFQSAVSLVPQNSAQPVTTIRQMTEGVQSVPNAIPVQPLPVEPGVVQTAPPEWSMKQIFLAAAPALWLGGVLALLVYSLVTLVRLRLRLRYARPLPQHGGNVYALAAIRSPFVFGLLQPRIYLPEGLTHAETIHILAHERTHLHRGDHWVKAIAWLALCLHWFNPLVWVSFFLLEKDMELSCDELAVRHYTAAQKKEYSMTLLQLASPRRFVMGCPLAFGENNVKGRVRNVLNPKKPALWLIVATVVLVAVLSVALAADPADLTTGSSLPASSAAQSGDNTDQDPYQNMGTLLYQGYFVSALKGELFAENAAGRTDLDWEDFKASLGTLGYTVLEDEGTFEVEDPDAPGWSLVGVLANSPDGEGVSIATLGYLYISEDWQTGPWAEVDCLDLTAPVYRIEVDPLSSAQPHTVESLDEVQAYFAKAFADYNQQTADIVSNNTQLTIDGKNAALDGAFEGSGLVFAIGSNWTVQEVQTEDIRYHKFLSGERELFTYHFGEEWTIQFPATEQSVHDFYNTLFDPPRQHEILKLEEFPIGGNYGQKLVLLFPQENLVQIQYCTVVPDALVYKNASNQLLSSVNLAQSFVFECTYDQLTETEALADAVVGSARSIQQVIWRTETQITTDAVITPEAAVGVAEEEAEDWGFAPERGYQTEVELVDYEGQNCYRVQLSDIYPRGVEVPGWFVAYIHSNSGEVLYIDCTKNAVATGSRTETDAASARKLARAVYNAFLAGDRILLDARQWWVPDFHSDGLVYEYLLLDLDGDGVEELLIQMEGEPGGYNGIFHYENGRLLCWNSDAAEMSSRDYPLQNGCMVRQYDYNGTRSYTVFRYQADGKANAVSTFFAREERIPESSTEPCPYYEIDGTEVDQAAFDKQLAEQVTDQLLEGSAWTKIGI